MLGNLVMWCVDGVTVYDPPNPCTNRISTHNHANNRGYHVSLERVSRALL